MPDTPLLARHQALGANLTLTMGWQVPADFGNPASEHLASRESATLIDLSHRGKLRISGPDAPKFLHGMLSNRVEDLRPGEGVYATFLTRQGKFVADLHLYRGPERFEADLAPGMATVFSEAIDMYIIMDKVEMEDLTTSQASLGLFGPNSLKILKSTGIDPGELPEHGHIDIEGTTIAREPWTGDEGYLLTTPSNNTENLWDGLIEAGATPAGLTAFETLTLEAGTPLFGPDMNSNINPMQAGLETTAIDFNKGCYIGQEVIAKIKYLGQVNRGLCGIRLSGERIPSAGAKVEANGEEVGTLTRAAYCPTEGQNLAFALLHRKAMDTGCQVTVLDGEVSLTGEVADLPFYKN
jgi:folate-binding protein YgfZ